MTDEDARLTDFVGAGGDGQDGEGDDPSDGGADSSDGPADSDGHEVGGPDAADDDGAVDANAGTNGQRASVDTGAAEEVEPAAPTADWTPGGAECAGCGTVVERRWRDGGSVVCADCKEW